MIGVRHVVAGPIIFFLFYDQDWQGRVFKVMTIDHFLVFLSVLRFTF